jgi:hypothetical protein
VIEDKYAIPVQEDAPPGSYRVAVGMYDPETGLRLPGTDGEGQLLESNRLLLSEMTIE